MSKAPKMLYRDMDGNEVSLHKLCVIEPDWAESRIRVMTDQIESLTAENAALKAIEYTRTMPAEIIEELHVVAKAWLRHLDRQKARSEFLAKAAALARAGDTVEARRMKSRVDSAPRVYDGARMEPVMRKFVKWMDGKKR